MKSFIAWLFNDSTLLAPETDVSLRLGQQPEGWQVFLMVLGVIVFAVWIYRKDGAKTASLGFRAFLGVLRGLLIAVALLILAEPVLLATHIETRRSTVILLLDDSFSMDLAFADADEGLRKKLQSAMGNATVTVKAANGKPETAAAKDLQPRQFKTLTRLDVVSAALRATHEKNMTLIDALKERHNVKIVTFASYSSNAAAAGTGEDEKTFDPTVSIKARAGETRIGDCLRAALKEMRGQPLAGIVVVSDGRQNAGEDAVQAAQLCKVQRVPIFAVGIGDPSEPKDLEVTFEGPEMILPDDQSEGTALVRFKGFTNLETIIVEMKNGDKVIATENVKLGKPGEKTPVPMHFKESKPGKYTYTISVPEQPGELRTENNVVTYNFEVVDKKVKVLFVEGQDLPRWEYRYLKNALRRDHTTEVDVLLATGEGAFLWDGTDGKQPLEQFPIHKREIAQYDVLMLGDVNPTTIFTSDQVNLIRDFVRDGGGFIMIAGERYAPMEYAQGVWAEMLPIVPQRGPLQPPDGGFQESFGLELTPEARKLAWTHLDPDENINREVWENLPHMYWYYPVKRKKELATVIAVHPFDKDEQGNKMPIIVTMPYGSGRTMFIGVDSLWRWRRGVGDRYHYRFYNQAIRHLSMAKRLGGQKRFYLGTDRNVAAIGDRVIISAIVKDQDLKEVTADKVTVHGKTPKGEDFTRELTRIRDRPGNYEGDYYPVMQGDFSMWLKDDSQPDAHQSEVMFKVEKPQLEYENPKLDEELLKNMARASGDGGEYFTIDKMHDIVIQPREETFPREKSINLWDNWVTFLIFTGLITLEWVLRKRGQML